MFVCHPVLLWVIILSVGISQIKGLNITIYYVAEAGVTQLQFSTNGAAPILGLEKAIHHQILPNSTSFNHLVVLWVIVLYFGISQIKGLNITIYYVAEAGVTQLQFSTNGAAPILGLEKAIHHQILPNSTSFKVIHSDHRFDKAKAMGNVIELYEKEKVDAFVGVPASEVLQYTGMLMSHFKLPVFSQAATDPRLGDKSVYRTLIRLAPPFSKVGIVVKEMCLSFGWRRILLISRDSLLCDYSTNAVFHQLTKVEVIIPAWEKFNGDLDDVQLPRILEMIKSRARIVFFCGDIQDKSNFMLAVHNANMTTAEYVYIMPPYRPLDDAYEPWNAVPGNRSEALIKASHAFIQISMFSLHGDEVNRFLEEHVQRITQDFNYSVTDLEKRSSKYALFLHDATYLYILAVNKTLEEGGDPRNGTRIVEIARNTTFEGVSGHVAFDDNGDREPTCSLWYVKPGENTSRLWARVILSNPVGQKMEIIEESIWRTPDGAVPMDAPKCGFSNKACALLLEQSTSLAYILSPIFFCLVINIIIMTAVLKLRNRRADRKRQQQVWKVNPKDIVFIEEKKFSRSMKTFCLQAHPFPSLLSSIRDSKTSLDPSNFHQLFTKVATYKGQLVSVKALENLNLCSDDLGELAVMRELRHENVCVFVGLCVEAGNRCLLTEYCHKGSLQDILENDNIQLDNIFKESLIFDLINGMVYLHSSPLTSHGNLKSSNCVIDSRWVLKVTDFRPKCVQKVSSHNPRVSDIYKEMLWTAPEILRSRVQLFRGSPPGDVFSFSIILQEILYRALPYFMENISTKEIIEKVKSGGAVPYRPVCPRDGDVNVRLLSLMADCWAENPEDRPSFFEIKKSLQALSERGKVNPMDRMIQKLESYSSNLEEIVRERTEALNEEKTKTDLLLYQMLPTLIADQLKQGLQVSPQLYKQATIYFSHIVDFVEIAAESSALEVVTLLNDLYEKFDNLIRDYDVYKVETIGDSYVVVSGIPAENGNRHVAEIAEMSLHMIQTAKDFQIRHRPRDVIQLRIGFHTGPCCAGVVGLAMPRYCLFGDTMNTASRMETNGQALKIHISSCAFEALNTFGNYDIVERGTMFIKGKGTMKTYWLEGKTNNENICLDCS